MALLPTTAPVHHALRSIDRRALTCGIGVWLTVTAAFALQIDNPWWGAFAAFRGVQMRSAYLRRNRLLGTLVGCALGFALAGLIVDDQPVALAVTFIVVVVGTYRRFTSAASYAWLLGTITALLIINAALFTPGNTFQVTADRLAETLLAVTIVAIVERCLIPGPPDQRSRAPANLSEAERHEFAVVALASGVTVIVLGLIWLRFNLPEPLTVLITTLVVYSTTISAQSTRSAQRFGGVLLGGGAGLFVAGLGIEAFWLWSAIFVVCVASFSAYADSGRPDSYVGVQAGFGFLVATVTGNGPIASIMPVLDRIIGIAFGIVVATIVLLSIHALLGKAPTARQAP